VTGDPEAAVHEPRPPAPRRRRRAGRYLLAAAFTALLVVVVLPDLLFGLDGHTPFAQMLAFRPWELIGLAVLLLLLAAATVRFRALWPFAAGALAVLVVGSSLVLPRAFPGPMPAGGTPLTVLSFNTYEGRADVQALAAEIKAVRPDLVSLPEAGDRFRAKLAPLIEPLGYRLKASVGRHEQNVDGVTTAVAARLGDVTIDIGDETTAFPYLVVTGGALGSLTFVAFHSVAPTLRSTPFWRHDLALLPQWCTASAPVVVAGDFNATLDHAVFRDGIAGCSDAAAQRGDGLIPTWGPTDLTRHTVGPQIDHVVASGGIAASAFQLVDLPGSDHRAILTTLQVPAGILTGLG
jgi:endonuclease/exonuclease/phosphatase (EEP) superfamily protein YafD